MDEAEIEGYIRSGNIARDSLNPAQLVRVAKAMSDSIRGGGKVICMGNGGSAADSQHFVAELVGRFEAEGRALPAIALTTNTSVLTALANDYSYDMIFSRQVEALAKPGDVVVGISTSGNSKNVVEALAAAKRIGCRTVSLTGKRGKIPEMTDEGMNIGVDSPRTSVIQEAHICAIHLISKLIEDELRKG